MPGAYRPPTASSMPSPSMDTSAVGKTLTPAPFFAPWKTLVPKSSTAAVQFEETTNALRLSGTFGDDKSIVTSLTGTRQFASARTQKFELTPERT